MHVGLHWAHWTAVRLVAGERWLRSYGGDINHRWTDTSKERQRESDWELGHNRQKGHSHTVELWPCKEGESSVTSPSQHTNVGKRMWSNVWQGSDNKHSHFPGTCVISCVSLWQLGLPLNDNLMMKMLLFSSHTKRYAKESKRLVVNACPFRKDYGLVTLYKKDTSIKN